MCALWGALLPVFVFVLKVVKSSAQVVFRSDNEHYVIILGYFCTLIYILDRQIRNADNFSCNNDIDELRGIGCGSRRRG